jgi:ribosome-associated heat shock protein Hsp15
MGLTMNEPVTTHRVDKYLHHIRIFKTRTLAAQACARGNVKIGGQTMKASRDLKPGDVLQVERGELEITLRVTAFSRVRLGAQRVPEFSEDLTPPENYQKAAERRRERALIMPHAHELVAKPDKKQLRELRKFWEEQSDA